MKASVIVCTYNRADSLRDTLHALRAQRLAVPSSWEVIVVDNNSKDHTRSVVCEMQSAWPMLRYEFEQSQGLSFARNHGVAVARGETLLFTDDDVLPEPNWLETTLAGLDKYNADACGGYIEPIWELPPPAWLTERFYGFLAIRTDRTDDFPIRKRSEMPFGANMAVRKAAFARIGMFDTSRGRKGKVLSGGEDIELFDRILAAGMTAFFLGQSRVRHKVEAFRMKKSYFRHWRLQSSRNIAISRGVPGNRRVFNIPLYLFPQLLRAILRAVEGYITKPSDEVLHREMIVFHFLGTFQGLWQTRRKSA